MLPFIIAWMTCGVPRFSAVKTGPRTALGNGRQCHPGGPPVALRPGGSTPPGWREPPRPGLRWEEAAVLAGSASATAAALNAAALASESVAGDQVIPGYPPGRSDVMGVLPWRAPVALLSARLAGWLVRWTGAGVRGRASRAA